MQNDGQRITHVYELSTAHKTTEAGRSPEEPGAAICPSLNRPVHPRVRADMGGGRFGGETKLRTCPVTVGKTNNCGLPLLPSEGAELFEGVSPNAFNVALHCGLSVIAVSCQ